MTDPFARFGLFLARRRWIVLGIWIVVLGAGAAFSGQAASIVKTGGFIDPNSESDRASQILQQDFHASSDNTLIAVFHSGSRPATDPTIRRQIESAARRLRAVEHVRYVSTYFGSHNALLLSPDRHTTLVSVIVAGDQSQVNSTVQPLRNALSGVRTEHYLTGRAAIDADTFKASEEDLRRAELVTVPVVLILLLLVFRTVISAAIPLVLGGAAIVLGQALLVPIGSITDVSVFALNVASMIGLGLGIDFSLLLVNRFRSELARGLEPDEAVAVTMATAGRSIVYSGITVTLAMVIFSLVMLPFMVVRSISLGVMLVALTALLAGTTFLPALLAALGRRVEWLPVYPRRKAQEGDRGIWYRLSHAVMRRPWVWLAASLLILAALAFPARDLTTVGTTTGHLPQSKESVQGANLMEKAFGAGTLVPVQVVIQTGRGQIWNQHILQGIQTVTRWAQSDPRSAQVESLATVARAARIPSDTFPHLTRSAILANPRLAAAASSFVDLHGANDAAVITIFLKSGEYARPHQDFVENLRDSIIPGTGDLKGARVLVGGEAANFIDLRDAVYGRFPLVIAAVMAAIFIILMMFFQSLFLPLKAMFMNLASILATYGALVLIFQHGIGDRLLGFKSIGMLDLNTPPVLYAVLFALSTDYEVFMLSRVKEYYHRSHNNEEAVAAGLQSTAGIITAAGLILIGTFGSFATASVLPIKEVGVGLAIAVALDTTVVRVIMVPATMRLMGDWNWWMPGWLKRIVPELREGPAIEPQPAAAVPSIASALRPTGGSVGMPVISLPAGRPFRIGRDKRNELQLFDPEVSRFHATMMPVGETFAIRDLGSANGVYVNYEKIPANQTVQLRPGDSIQVGGKWELCFAFEPAVPQATPVRAE